MDAKKDFGIKQENKMKQLITTLIITSIFFISCESEEDQYADRESELLSLISEDDVLGLDGLDDGGAVEDEYTEGSFESSGKINSGKVMEEFSPDDGYTYRFGRKIISKTKTITFTHEDDFSIADINRSITGEFVCMAIDTTFEPDSTVMDTSKPFTSNFHRKVRFLRNEETTGRRWKIDALTIGTGMTGDLIDIIKLEYKTRDSESDNWISAYVVTGDNVDTTWIDRDSIPTFPSWSEVKVEVSVSNNSDPVFNYKSGEGVRLHYGLRHNFKARRKLHDDGNDPDENENDNIFTKSWLIHGPGILYNQRIFRSFYDVIDYNTLFNTEAGVHTAVWALPYKVIRE